MPVECELREDGHVSYFKLIDPWTMEELLKGFAQANALRDTIHQQYPDRRIHSFVDMIETKDAPPGVMQGRKMPGLTHSTRGEIAVAVKNVYPRTIVEAMLKVMRADAHFFETRDEAWAYLHAIMEKPPVKSDPGNP